MVALAEKRRIQVRGPIWDHLFAPLRDGRWDAFPREQLFEGPAGTGKSMGIALWLDALALLFAGCRILVIRKTRVSLSQSWMVTFEEKVLPEGSPLKTGASRAHRQSYVYPNGSELVMGGMDNPTRTFSTEYDVIYVNEANEFTEDEVEKLHRALRNGRLPFQCMILDCNPDSEFHWLNIRCNEGSMVRRRTRLHDNPGYWVQDADTGAWGWSEAGRHYREGLRATMKGVNYLRLVRGEWVTAEGVIIPLERDVHVLEGQVKFPVDRLPVLVLPGEAPVGVPNLQGEREVEVKFFYGACDWGYLNPGTLQVWAVDAQRRAYLVHEIYQSGQDDDWWADQWLRLDERYRFHRVICDSAEPRAIKRFNRIIRRGRNERELDKNPVVIAAEKKGTRGTGWLEYQAMLMRDQFSLARDTVPRAFLLANTLDGPDDPRLQGKPRCFLHEAVGWTYEPFDPSKHKGLPKEVGDPSKPNHAIDAASYGFRWLETHFVEERVEDRWPARAPEPGTWAAHEKFIPWSDET